MSSTSRFLIQALGPILSLALVGTTSAQAATKSKGSARATQSSVSGTTSAPAPAPTSNDTLIGGSSSGQFGSTLPASLHTRLSLMANYNFSDSFEDSRGGKSDAERGFVIGAQYEFPQFSQGLSAQIGTVYDFAREVKNQGGLKVSDWMPYGELVAKITPELRVMGGVNYNFPSLANAQAGRSVKGKIGFQLGASYQFTQNLAIDARYRQQELDDERTVQDDFGNESKETVGVKSAGVLLGGRFIF